jgi:aspartate/methionine/tyrosine aminotransferase
MPSDDPPPTAPFPYMRYAKRRLGFDKPMNLGMSGVRPPGEAMLVDLGMRSLAHAAGGRTAFAAALAARFEVDPAQVHVALGTSHANFIVALALARGGRILVEEPGYEAFAALGPAVGAEVRPLPRLPELAWAFDPAALEAAAGEGADLVFVSDLHNPSGRRLDDAGYAALAHLAEATGAWIVVDEVYADFDPQVRPSAVHRHRRFLVTSSLTKVHGLGDLRAGWILGTPEVIDRIDAWDDVVSPAHCGPILHEAATYMAHAVQRAEVARDRAAWRLAQVQRWIDATPHVSWVPPHGGITGFVRVGDGPEDRQGDRLAAQAEARHGVLLIPGSYFQRPAWVRLSYDLPEEVLGPALDGVALAARELFG